MIEPVRRPKPPTKKSSRAFRLRNIELDELHSFAGAKHPDEQEADLDQVGQHWTHVAMARESRLMLEVVVGPRTQESATELVEGAARRPGPWLLAVVVKRWMGAIPVCADSGLRRLDPFHQGQGARPSERFTASCLIRECGTGKLSNSARGGVWWR